VTDSLIEWLLLISNVYHHTSTYVTYPYININPIYTCSVGGHSSSSSSSSRNPPSKAPAVTHDLNVSLEDLYTGKMIMVMRMVMMRMVMMMMMMRRRRMVMMIMVLVCIYHMLSFIITYHHRHYKATAHHCQTHHRSIREHDPSVF